MKVALLGLGNVGRAVYEILIAKASDIFQSNEITIKYILVRDKAKYKDVEQNLLTTNFSEIVNDPEIEVVIEMMGASISFEYMYLALSKKKHVITANKEVIAQKYEVLQSLAMKKRVKLLFEASVGGGIPIVHTLLNSAPFNQITEIRGILNGTTNFILTSMHKEHLEFDSALALAQKKGFAEADPTADLEGLDAVRKIAILSMIGYGTKIKLEDIYHYGIRKVTKKMVEIIDLLGYRLKFVASSIFENDGVIIAVEPVMVKGDAILANVDYEYNIVEYKGKGCATQMMYGKGAGPVTANAIVFDLGLILADYKQNFLPTRALTTTNKGPMQRYIIKPLKPILREKTEKNFKEFIITKPIMKEELLKELPNIEFYARILED